MSRVAVLQNRRVRHDFIEQKEKCSIKDCGELFIKVQLPSMVMTAPFIKRDSSEAKYSASCATSCAWLKVPAPSELMVSSPSGRVR